MIILMGVAGAGKSLQGKLITDELGYRWLSTGEIFRSQLSEERKKEMLSGKLLDDTEVIAIVDKTLKELGNNVVLDGFPRTIVQAEWLLNEIKHLRFELTAVFNLVATKEVVRARLLARGRSDDDEQVIKKRFDEYENKTVPILNFFKQQRIVVYEINGDQTPEAVHQTIMKYINK
ncbi:MAG: adenylate kinase family protein [Candidatus Saccharimonadales bacterium]